VKGMALRNRSVCSGSIQRSAWKVNSAKLNFRFTAF
jgi:hypothetical protein